MHLVEYTLFNIFNLVHISLVEYYRQFKKTGLRLRSADGISYLREVEALHKLLKIAITSHYLVTGD